MDEEVTGKDWEGEAPAEPPGQEDEVTGGQDAEDGRDAEAREAQGDAPVEDVPEVERLRAELDATRKGALEAHRRALLAENAGKVVPELITGETVEALEGSIDLARRAFETVRAATLAEVAAGAPVGAGNGQRGSAVDVEGLSPMQKIAYGLRPARD